MSDRYAVCKNNSRPKPNVKVNEEITKSIGENYRTLPLFEKGLHEFTYKNLYSLENNGHLRCRWNEYRKSFGDRTFSPFQFVDVRDYHFYNNRNRLIPSESVHKRGQYRMTLKPGPGVDFRGVMPIPHELIMNRSKRKVPKINKPPKCFQSHEENNKNVLNSHLA